MRKKGIILSVLALGGAVAYMLVKNKQKQNEYEEVTYVSIQDDEDDEEEIFDQKIEELHEIYPYLSKKFINGIYKEQENFNQKYQGNIKLEHIIVFDSENDANIFLDVCGDNAYEVEKDGLKVQVNSYFENTNGRIMSDILSIANQANSLTGSYLGYRIEVEKI
ncbi:MAG: hypothetical protein MR210_08700 [Erysipelotrichaceae bacterium]|nr:hypothetical protein [Erysipelotrichaceae bacterium]MDY5251475.1 hypothetical protein [Erysipelotrichaceae bacterium]